ncbi:MAG: hypothetical protein WDW36_000377 [Sanguina aurantia]
MAEGFDQAGSCIRTNLVGLTQYDNRCNFFTAGTAPLPAALGWFIVCGLGFVFSICTACIVWADTRLMSHFSSEHFSTAGRSIKMGLTACDIVSKWTWAATMLQSSNVAWKYGISGPFWGPWKGRFAYAAGATIQILLFSVLAVEVKRKAPTVHTVLEIIHTRWGQTAHLTFLCFCLMTNLIVTAMLILGGAAVIEALSGVNIYAAALLIPVGVMIYTAQGGLKATFLASWAHVAIVYIALCIFMFMVYTTSPDLGSAGRMYDNLRLVEKTYPVADNLGGSYLTMLSKSGFIFGIINIIGNFGTVFVDQAYWQSAIAAKPSATYQGYLMGGLCWFAIPFTLATTMGLAARALDLPLTLSESNAGLVPPAVAVHLLGKGGAFLLVLQLFMAVTASGAAEQMAVASLIAYDVWRPYVNKRASGAEVVLVSRIVVMLYGVLSGLLAIILLRLGLDLGWVYTFMGILIGSAVFPMAACITWKKCSAVAAVTSAVAGCPLAVLTWLVVAAQLNGGVLTLETTGQDYPMLAGNLVALFFSAALCIALSYIWPQDYDWRELRSIPTVEQDPHANQASCSAGSEPCSTAELEGVLTWTYATCGVMSVILVVVWPLLTLPAGIFTKGYFTFWVLLAVTWGLVAAAICILVPIWEARVGLVKAMARVWALLRWGRDLCDPSVRDGTLAAQFKLPSSPPPADPPLSTQSTLALYLEAHQDIGPSHQEQQPSVQPSQPAQQRQQLSLQQQQQQQQQRGRTQQHSLQQQQQQQQGETQDGSGRRSMSALQGSVKACFGALNGISYRRHPTGGSHSAGSRLHLVAGSSWEAQESGASTVQAGGSWLGGSSPLPLANHRPVLPAVHEGGVSDDERTIAGPDSLYAPVRRPEPAAVELSRRDTRSQSVDPAAAPDPHTLSVKHRDPGVSSRPHRSRAGPQRPDTEESADDARLVSKRVSDSSQSAGVGHVSALPRLAHSPADVASISGSNDNDNTNNNNNNSNNNDDNNNNNNNNNNSNYPPNSDTTTTTTSESPGLDPTVGHSDLQRCSARAAQPGIILTEHGAPVVTRGSQQQQQQHRSGVGDLTTRGESACLGCNLDAPAADAPEPGVGGGAGVAVVAKAWVPLRL